MNLKCLVTLCAAFLCLVFASGCSKEPAKNAAATTAAEKTPIGQVPSPLLREFDAYFPREAGRTWTYVVSRPANMPLPLKHEWIHSSIVPNKGPSELFGTLTPTAKKNPDGRTLVVLRSEGETKELDIYSESTAIAVDRDDIGYFGELRRLYWGISPIQWRNGDYIVTQHVKYPVKGSAPETYSVRTIFFEGKGGHDIEVKGENEKLTFVGNMRVDGRDCLHFRRVVTRPGPPPPKLFIDNPEYEHMLSPFNEDMWFERGVGLIRLVQTTKPNEPGSRVIMIWELQRK